MKTLYNLSITISIFISYFSASARTENSNATAPAGKNKYEVSMRKSLEGHARLVGQVIYFSDHIADLESNPDQIIKRKAHVEKEISDEIARLKNLSVGSDSSFMDSVITYYKVLRSGIEKEYDDAIALRLKLELTHAHIHAFLGILENADHNIVQAENLLHAMEVKYAKEHSFQVPAEEDRIRERVMKNESVIKYHNKLFMVFYNIYSIENEILEKSANLEASSESEIASLKITLAKALVLAEDTVEKLGIFEKDASLPSTIKSYFSYLRSQNFVNFEFYYTYSTHLEKLKQVNKKSIGDDKSHYQKLRESHAKLSGPRKTHEGVREKLLERVEFTSFKFLYNHSPVF